MNIFQRKQPTDTEAHILYLDNHIKNLELNLQRTEQQLKQMTSLTEGYRSDARKNMSELQRVAETICDNDFSKKQLGGVNRILSLSSFELANFIIENWQKQREESISLIIDLQKALKTEEGKVKDLEAQLERTLQQQKEMAHLNQIIPGDSSLSNEGLTIQHNGRKIDPETGEILSGPEENELKVADIPDILEVVKQSSSSSQEEPSYEPPKTHLVLMEEIETKLSDVQYGIIEIIGSKGISEPKEIEQLLMDSELKISHTQFVNALNGLKQNLIVGEDKVNTGWRWFMALHLTDLGLQLYLKKAKKPAILCEKHILRRDHATWDHGYCIKDTATLMDMMGYTKITYDRKSNEIVLTNGKVWIPDIIAYDPIANKKVYIEVELGHHTQEQFNEKMDKARQITNDLRFVTNDKQAMETIISQFSRWKLEKKQQGQNIKNFTVWITTTKKLADKDWGNEYPS